MLIRLGSLNSRLVASEREITAVNINQDEVGGVTCCQWVGGKGGVAAENRRSSGGSVAGKTPQTQPAGNKSNTCCFEPWDAGMAGISLAT